MKVKFIFLCLSSIIIILSAYVYWPIWNELKGRAVDQEMTLKTEQAIKNNKVDSVYVELAKATGGSVCSADGKTPEEKNKNLQKCLSAMDHRELVKNKDTEIRRRFLFIKNQFLNLATPIFLILWAITFFIAIDHIKQSVLIAIYSMVPNIIFWISIGGFSAIADSELNIRGGSHLPLIGALLTGFLVLVLNEQTSTQPLSKWAKRAAFITIVLIGLVPSGLILLIAGSC